jgi:hypothetical protein
MVGTPRNHPITVVFRENDSELKTFNRKGLIFLSKMFSRFLPCFSEEENAEKVMFEEVLGFFPTFSLPLAMYHRMFRENDPEPEIFNRKVFFSSKVFSRSYPHFGKVKNQKKLFPKSGWISMDSPTIFSL